MRIFLLILFSPLLALCAEAQIVQTCEFDFANPTTLSPSITPASTHQGEVNLTDYEFTGIGANSDMGYVHLSFSKYKSSDIGARLCTYIGTEVTSYQLDVYSRTYIRFKASQGARITKVAFSNDGRMAGLHPVDGQTGTMSDDNFVWTKSIESDGSDSLLLYNGHNTANVKKITVTYTVPAAQLTIAPNIESGSTLSSFSKLVLSLGRNVQSVDQSRISIASAGTSLPFTTNVSGTNVVLTLGQPITSDATIAVSIPAGCITTTEGYGNREATYTYYIEQDHATFNYISAQYQDAIIESLPSGFSVTFPSTVGSVKDALLTLNLNGSPKFVVKPRVSDDDKSIVVFDFQNNIKEIGLDNAGTYTLEVPEQTVFDQLAGTSYQSYNPRFTLTYTIGKIVPPDSEAMTVAKQLLQKTGVGYPSTESAEYKHLQTLVNQEETPTDEDLLTAISDLYKVTDVVQPVTGKYYNIAGVNADGDRLYFTYDSGRIGLSAKNSLAASFSAVNNEDGTVTFKTTDGKYLYVLSDLSSKYTALNESNVTTDSTAINALLLQKLIIDTVAVDKTYGLMTMYGSLGTTEEQTTGSAFARINFERGKITTLDNSSTLIFNSTTSNAFAFFEVGSPDVPDNPMIGDSISLSPTVTVDESDSEVGVTLTFGNGKIAKFETVGIRCIDSTGASKSVSSVTNDPMAGNVLRVVMANLSNGDYTLVINAGNLTWIDADNVSHPVKQLSIPFSVTGSTDPDPTPDPDPSPDPAGDFDASIYPYEIMPNGETVASGINAKPYASTYLNEWGLYMDTDEYPVFVASASKKVKLKTFNTETTVKEGTFKQVDYQQGTIAYRIAWDGGDIKVGDLRVNNATTLSYYDCYKIVVEPATFGDANFEKYLLDPTSVAASKCKVNAQLKFSFWLNDSIATGIDGIMTDRTTKQTIYDLSGRRLKSADKPGLYIINGKKMVVK